MPENILINVDANDKASKKLKSVEQQVTSLGQKSKQVASQQINDTKRYIDHLENLGSQFRYLSLVSGIASAAMLGMTNNIIQAAKEGEQAFLKLSVFAARAGESMSKTDQLARDLANTGLVSLSDASEGVANLLASDLNLDQVEKLMYRMIDASVLAKENLNDTFGQAVVKSTQGLRIFQERQVDAIGVNFRMDQVFQEFAKTLGKTSAQLSSAEKHQALYNYLMQETERYVGGADLASNTFSGTLSKLNARFFEMRKALGDTLVPLIGTFAEQLTNVTIVVEKFTKEHAFLVGAVITGVVAFTTLIAAVAGLGALIPLLASGFSVLTGGLATFVLAGIKMIAISALISAAIGGLIFAVLKATGQWDKWTAKIAELRDKIKESITPLQDLTDKTEELTDAQRKQLETLARTGPRTMRDLREGLREWVDKHDKSVQDIKGQIGDLEREYDRVLKKINGNFDDTMSDMEIRHARKVEDLQRDIDEETSKGIWADQTRIRDLKLSLKRENEDYTRATQDRIDDKNAELEEEKTRINDRLKELRDELSEREELEKKHADVISYWRTLPIRDEVEKLRDATAERLSDLALELNEVINSTTQQSSAINGVADQYINLSNAMDQPKQKIYELTDETKRFTQEQMMAMSSIEQMGFTVRLSLQQTFSALTTGTTNAISRIPDSFKNAADIMSSYIPDFIKNPVSSFFGGLFGSPPKEYQDGGVIPGSPSQPVPIIAHGGETVLPAGSSPVTVNINNPTVREDRDIQLIADKVQEVLSRRTYLKRFQ